MRSLGTVVIRSLVLPWAGGLGVALADDRHSALAYLNALRQQAGLPALSAEPLLARAAQDHARYLSRHRATSHYQQPGRSGFSGRTADERAVGAGYASRSVSENISRGQADSHRSIDDLMSALYHRLGFLDAAVTEIGIGEASGGARLARAYVYLLGNRHQAALCQGRRAGSASGFPAGYYDQVCHDDRRVDAPSWDAATRRPLRAAPDMVVWPPPDSDHVLPACYDEIPDPLPQHKVSGYPLSVQFNPAVYTDPIRLRRFALWDGQSGRKLAPIVVLQAANDPNQKLTAGQFALFPHDRLRWGHPYRAEFVYDDGAQTHTLRWQFSTRRLNYPIVRVAASGSRYAVASGQTSAVVIAPALGRELYRDVRWRTPAGMRVDIDWEDENTLLVTLQGKPCGQVDLRFANGFRLGLIEADQAGAGCDGQLAGLDRIDHNDSPKPQSVERPPPGPPARGETSALPGNILQGKGELFTVRADARYIFSVEPTLVYPALGRIRYRATGGARLAIERLSDHSLALRVSGSPGDAVTLDLGDGRYFKVVLVR